MSVIVNLHLKLSIEIVGKGHSETIGSEKWISYLLQRLIRIIYMLLRLYIYFIQEVVINK